MSTLYLTRLVITTHYLKASQVFYRIYYRLRRLCRRSVCVEAVKLRGAIGAWREPKAAARATEDAVTFVFMGVQGRVDCRNDWNASRYATLWLYNLHYLDCLDVSSDERMLISRTLVNKWIEANPPMEGVGWHPYPLSIRVVNLVKFFACQPNVDDHWVQSLAVQAQALCQQIEYDVLGNHIFANGKALIFAASYLAGPDADQWMERGLRILDRELAEQFLTDGAHFERSPMYHSILLWDMCDLVNLSRTTNILPLRFREKHWVERIINGLEWLEYMAHPDGKISFFNDAAFGVAPDIQLIRDYVRTLGLQVRQVTGGSALVCQSLAASGYYVVEQPGEMKTIVDLAPVGPDYQPGHAHADTLSFEMSVYGQRLFVNSGTSQYGEGFERNRQRSTKAHNTVVVNERNSTDVWAGFRVASRAYPGDIQVVEKDGSIEITASHNGYRSWLKSASITHRRSWLFAFRSLIVQDVLHGKYTSAQARFHLHPAITVSEMGQQNFEAVMPSGNTISLSFEGACRVFIESTTWHPCFGQSVPNQCFVAEFGESTLGLRISW